MKLSQRVRQLAPSATLAITAKAQALKNQGLDVVSFGAGEPDFNTPDHVIEAAIAAMRQGHTKYTETAGIRELREAIAHKLLQDNQLSYSPEQITVANGAKNVLYNLFQVLLDPGDEVLIPVPYWVSYPEQVKLAGGVPVFVEGLESNQFKITPEQLQQCITDKSRILIINSPNNPTGAVYSREELMALGEVCLRHNLIIVSDEIYEKLLYEDAEHISIASLSPELKASTFVINGVSKPYAMTGWRIGYAAGELEVIRAMNSLSSQSISNPNTIAQYAALAAISGPQQALQEMREQFARRRQRMLEWVNQIPGLQAVPPMGAFYVYVNVSQTYSRFNFSNADQWAQALLEKAQVAVVPGSGFGTPDHVRLSYATSMEMIDKGMERIARFVQG